MGIYIGLRSFRAIDQDSFQAKTIWVLLVGIYDVAVLFFFLGPIRSASLHVRHMGFRSLTPRFFARFWGFWYKQVGPKTLGSAGAPPGESC